MAHFVKGSFLIATVFLLLFGIPSLATPETPPVRVGFFPMRGFHEYDHSGTPTGYDVDYLNIIRSYADINFQYIRTETWDEALALLAAGKIDLVGAAQINSERAERFDFTAYANGITYAAVITLSGNARLHYEDFTAFNNRRYGCVTSYIRKKEFAQYAEKKEFTPDMVWFDNTEQMRKALHAKEIDAMVCNVMELGPDEKVIAEFAPAPFYYMATKGNVNLLEKINHAIARIQIDTPLIETQLMDHYYPVQRIPSYSPEELHYAKMNPHIRVGLLPDRAPFSVYNSHTDDFSGIVPDLLSLISQESGLTFTPVAIPNGIPLELLENNSADIVAGVVTFPQQLRNPSIQLTEPFFTGNMIFLARRGEPFIPSLQLKIAVPQGFKAAYDFVKTTYPHFSITEYYSTDDCMKALQQRKVDVMIQNDYVLNRLLQGPKYDDLIVVPTVSNPEKLAIAIPADADPRLVSLLNKSIRRISNLTRNQIVINHTVAKPYSLSFGDFVKKYTNEIITFSAMFLSCLLLLAFALWQRKKNIDIVIEDEEKLRTITNNINGGVVTLSVKDAFPIIYTNNGFLKLIGLSRTEYEERAKTYFSYIHPDDVASIQEAIPQHIEKGDSLMLEMRMLHASGTRIPVLFRGTFSYDTAGNCILYSTIIDISEQRSLIESLKVEKARYEIVVEQSNDIIFEVDLEEHTLMCSPKFKEKFGWQLDTTDINDHAHYSLRIHPGDAEILQQILEEILHKEATVLKQLRIRKLDGEYLWCKVLVNCIRNDEKLLKLIGKIEDIDDMVRERQRLEEISQTDPLTGLYNKRALYLSIERSLKLTNGTGIESFLFFIDIDNFKEVNDTLGHLTGDQVLREIATSLRAVFRANDIIGRYGGDEFCIFVPRISESLAREKAEEIGTRLHQTYTDDSGHAVTVSASIGIAHAPHHGETYSQLVEVADKALYAAKFQGKNRYIFGDDGLGSMRKEFM